MLSFDSSLSNALKLGNTTAFWSLKLYYNSEGGQVYQADGTTANLINKLGSELAQDGDNPDHRLATWTVRDKDGNADGWGSGAPSPYEDDENASMINTLTGGAVDAGLYYSLTFTVGTGALSLVIGGGDLTGNTADETFVAKTSYAVGTHTVTFSADADRSHLWFTADVSSTVNGTIDDVTLKRNGYGAAETSIIVDHGAAFQVGDYIKIENEILEVTNISSETLTVVRGAKGSTKAAHADNTAIYFDNWLGVSDTHRVDGSDIYHGIVSSWGNYSQSLDFFNFTTTTGNMSVRLINTDGSIQGGRFSDLFSTNNFANRKWELFLNTNSAGTYDTAARMIGAGIISGEIKYDYKSIGLALLDNSNSAHNQVPINVVDVATHTNSPKGNINKPVPIFYGDCSADATALASGTSGNFDHHFVKGKFPAIITDKWNVTAAQVYARPDDVVVNDLDDFNVFSYKDGFYYQVNDSSADVSAANARVDFSGVDWRVFVPLAAHSTSGDVSNWGNTVDGDLTTYGALASVGGKGYQVDAYWRVPKVPNLGTIASVYFVIHYRDFAPDLGGTGIDINSFKVGVASANYQNLTWGTAAGSQAVDISSGYTDAEKEDWNFEDIIHLELNAGADTSTAHTLEVYQVGLEVRFSPSQTFEKQVTDYYEIPTGATTSNIRYSEAKGADILNVTKKVARTRTVTTPDVGEYVYVSGKGREYGAWIDTINSAVRTNANGDEPDPNYASLALIENPIYMIEDILRRELGLDGSTTGIDIDVETFDKAGNAQTDSSKGDIALLFNDAIADIKFAFSQYKFINSKDLITKICRQCMSFVFFSGSGKFKIKTLLLPSSTWGLEETIDFSEINIKNIGRTSLNNVRNKIIINYAEDYARDKMMESTTVTDSTSVNTTVNGFGDTLTLELDADCILDSTTADNLRNAYKDHYKDRKVIIDFDIVTPKYNHLEITDFISFSNWDANLKLYGTAFSSDVFIIQKISKKVNGCSISALKVD